MDVYVSLYACLTILVIFLIHNKLSGSRRYKLPPSPAMALPVIGHLHLMKQPLHRTFHRFSQITGPIFSLKLGVRNCVVVSSPELVEECFTKHDIVLANRPHLLVDEYIIYNHQSLLGAPHGDYWKSLRRIAAQELLSPARLNNSAKIRKDEMDRLLLSLYKESEKGFSKVELKPKLSELTFNVMTRMVAGKRYLKKDKENEKGQNFLKVINDVFEIAQLSDPQDFLPFLHWIDYGGFTKKMVSLAKETDGFFQAMIDEHREEKRDTMIGNLVCLQESQPELCSDVTIKGLALSMILGGSDTSSVTIEWVMSVLLNHPRVLKTVRAELEAKVGLHRLINEYDLPNLPYLRNVILETLRLYPSGPLLISHAPSKDIKLGGYDVLSGTIVFINAWAIHRDPELWEETLIFKPERFEGKEVEPHKLMPFGMGRRACPGNGLAQRVVGVALGSLIQCFDWERESAEEVDLTAGIGLTMPKLDPLKAMCKPREIMNNIFKEQLAKNETMPSSFSRSN